MYFDESAVSVVDTWLKTATGTEDVGVSLEAPKSAPKASAAPAVHEGGNSRSGIGFQAPKRDPKAPDVLTDKFNKSMKKKRSLADMNNLTDSHGIIEEEISKIKAPKIVPKADKPATPTAPVAPSANVNASNNKGFSNNKQGEAQGFAKSTFKQQPQGGGAVQQQQQQNNREDMNNQRPKEAQDGNRPPWFGGGAEGGQQKRTKTRSKQKNIRRDTRRDEFKPEHLRMGSKDYKGRPLTQVRK